MKVSVITINYNNKEGLDETIQSVASQKFDDYEYIIIDGGSTDGSIDVIRKYEECINYWVSEKDSGIYNAMNKGIQKATGEYLHFLNSGDCYYSNDVLDFIFKNKTYREPLLRGMQIFNFPDGEILSYNHGFEKITFYTLYHHWICHQATFIARSLFLKYGLYDESYKIVSDWLFFAKVILHDEKSIFVEKIVSLFDVNGESSDSKKTESEKDKALVTLLPNSILKDYERLNNLEKELVTFYDDPLFNFINAYKLPKVLLRILRKSYNLLGMK